MTISFKEKYPIKSLINENEDDVFRVIDRILQDEKIDICTCDECMLDVAAIALNNLTPRYRVLIYRHIHRDEETELKHKKEVEKVVKNALESVRKNPHHDEDI